MRRGQHRPPSSRALAPPSPADSPGSKGQGSLPARGLRRRTPLVRVCFLPEGHAWQLASSSLPRLRLRDSKREPTGHRKYDLAGAEVCTRSPEVGPSRPTGTADWSRPVPYLAPPLPPRTGLRSFRGGLPLGRCCVRSAASPGSVFDQGTPPCEVSHLCPPPLAGLRRRSALRLRQPGSALPVPAGVQGEGTGDEVAYDGEGPVDEDTEERGGRTHETADAS